MWKLHFYCSWQLSKSAHFSHFRVGAVKRKVQSSKNHTTLSKQIGLNCTIRTVVLFIGNSAVARYGAKLHII